MSKGQFILLTQNTSKIAIDTSGSGAYSDFVFQTPIWTKLNTANNWRFYLNPLTNISNYQTTFSLTKAYKSIGVYNLVITFNSSNQTFQQTVNITDCMIFLFIFTYYINYNT